MFQLIFNWISNRNSNCAGPLLIHYDLITWLEHTLHFQHSILLHMQSVKWIFNRSSLVGHKTNANNEYHFNSVANFELFEMPLPESFQPTTKKIFHIIIIDVATSYSGNSTSTKLGFGEKSKEQFTRHKLLSAKNRRQFIFVVTFSHISRNLFCSMPFFIVSFHFILLSKPL